MVTSKRVTTAKSEQYLKACLNGGKKPIGFWQNVRKQLKTHPLIIAFFFFVMVFSGVFTFFMSLSSERREFGGY